MNLSQRQCAALSSMLGNLTHPMDKSFSRASAIGASPATLSSLESVGLVERRWANSSLRGGEHWTYRLTNRGYNVARRQVEAAR